MNPINTRETFDNQLSHLSQEVLSLGKMAEIAIRQSMQALQQADRGIARQSIRNDLEINKKRYALENNCVTLIATQQPMGRDVRFLTAILEIITELERIADYAKGVSKVTIRMSEKNSSITIMTHLQEMAEMGLSMLERSLEAFMRRDTESARSIPLDDDQVDHLYNQVAMELTNMVIKDPGTVQTAQYLMWAAHNLERLADRVTNICERVVYVNTGEMLEFDQMEDE
ncbi:MAG: phosphate transport system regulatory protein PhoU [Anaerolinea sp.]|nr:phosphate transport system regulatory protein PhoU [Anaerolinea sp.]